MADPNTGVDINFYSVADQDGVAINDHIFAPDNPQIYDTILKLSHATNFTGVGLAVDGHGQNRESAIDMNRMCSNINISHAALSAGKRDAVTIKGGCSGIRLTDIQIESNGSVDVEIGNWSDQSTAKTTGVVLDNLYRTDGKPIRVRVGRGDKPVMVNGKYEYLWFQSLLLKAYWWFKFITK